MAISAVPYVVQNGSHSADLFRQAVSSLVPPGGGIVSPGDLAVTQTGTASMNIVFGVGRAWVPGTNVGNVSGGNFSKQAMYFALNDAAFTASVTTSDATNPRIDVAYLAIQDSQYAGTANTVVLGIAAGVPTAGATYPTNAPTVPANAISLAWINVPANASSIQTSNITQILNPYIGPLARIHSEWTFNAATVPSGTVWGTGTLTIDTANSTDTGFISCPSADLLTIRDAGTYAIDIVGTWGTATTGRGFTQITDSGATTVYSRSSAAIGENSLSTSLANFRCAANTTIKLSTYLVFASGTVTWPGRVRITRIG